MIEEQRQNGGGGQIMINKDGKQIPLKNDDIVNILQGQQKQLAEQQEHIKKLVEQLQIRDNIIMQMKAQLKNINQQINNNKEITNNEEITKS